MEVDQQITEEIIMTPSGGTFNQLGGSSYRFKFLWKCTMKFSDLPLNSCLKTKFLYLPSLENEAFRFALTKDSISTFSLNFLRIPTESSTTYKPVEIKVEYHLVKDGARPTKIPLLPAHGSVQVNFSITDIPNFQQFIYSTFRIICCIDVDNIVQDNFEVKYAKDEDYKGGHEHSVGSRQDVRKLSLITDHRDIIIRGSDFAYSVHGLVLAATSEYFLQEMRKLLPRTNVILVKNVSQYTIRAILTYIYSQRVTIDLDTVLDLVIRAKKFGVEKLVKTCLKFLGQRVNSKNAPNVFKIAVQYNDLDLKNKASAFIKDLNKANQQSLVSGNV